MSLPRDLAALLRMVPRRWRIAGRVTAVLVGSYLVVRPIALWMRSYQPACSQPCREMGTRLAEGETSRYGARIPACQPIKLGLETAPAPIRARSAAVIFFRATVSNVSCHELSLIAGNLTHPLGDYNIEREILDPGGNVLDSSKLSVPAKPREFERLVGEVMASHREIFEGKKVASPPDDRQSEPTGLYQDVEKPLSEYRTRLGAAPRGEYGIVDLVPGDSASTWGSRLAPYQETMSCGPVPGGGFGTFMVRVPVRAPQGALEVPEGFSAWSGLWFPKPGRYRMRLRYDGHGWFRPQFPLERFVPSLLLAILGFVEEIPEKERSSTYQVRAVSNTVEIDVMPSRPTSRIGPIVPGTPSPKGPLTRAMRSAKL